MIKKQIEVLNTGYKHTGLSFTLAGTNRVENRHGSGKLILESPSRGEIKTKLRKGGASTLNVYSLRFTDLDIILLGQATFPSSYKADPTDDGLILRYSVLPGGNINLKQGGKTLLHETEHWAGLFHTFQGGCNGNGDEVDDTPAIAASTYACPTVNPDTCPTKPGIDPIHNYMDYSSDDCRTQYTAGQIVRLKAQVALYCSVVFV